MHEPIKSVVIGATCTLITTSFVAILTFVIYEREDWPFELAHRLGTTIFLTLPMCSYLASKIFENIALSHQLQRLVDRDRLTDVATRDYFYAHLRSAKDVEGMSLMVDIDNFKSVNDTYGHYVGDDVIQAVAKVLRVHCRPCDTVCRFGGEEFVVFLNGMSAQEGLYVAEDIRAAVETLQVRTREGVIGVTVSIGVAMLRGAGDLDDAIKSADEAMYKAKRAGRNRTIMSDQMAA